MPPEPGWAGETGPSPEQMERTLCNVAGPHGLLLPISALGKAVAGHLRRSLMATRGSSRDDPGAAPPRGLQRRKGAAQIS